MYVRLTFQKYCSSIKENTKEKFHVPHILKTSKYVFFCRLTSFSSVIYILPVVTLSLLWNVSRFLELDTCYYMKNFTMEGGTSVEVFF